MWDDLYPAMSDRHDGGFGSLRRNGSHLKKGSSPYLPPKLLNSSLGGDGCPADCTGNSFDTDETASESSTEPSEEPLSPSSYQKLIRWADETTEEHLPLATILWLPPPEPEARVRLVILLLHPVWRQFEFVHCEYDSTMQPPLKVKDLLQQLPRLASTTTFQRLRYTSLCCGDTELVNALSLTDYDLCQEQEPLVAVPQGCLPRDVRAQAGALWNQHKGLRRAVRRAKLSGRALQYLQSPTELAVDESQAAMASATVGQQNKIAVCDSDGLEEEELVEDDTSDTYQRTEETLSARPHPPVSPADEPRDDSLPHDPQASLRFVILLLHPTKRIFEFVHCAYDPASWIKVRDVLEQLPSLASNSVLGELRYSALCCGFQELVNALPISEYGIAGEDVLVAVPEGCRSRGIMYRASALLSNKALRHTVRKAKLSGQALRKLTSSAELEALQRSSSYFDDEEEDEPVRDEQKTLQAVERNETSSSFRRSLQKQHRLLPDDGDDSSDGADAADALSGEIPAVAPSCENNVPVDSVLSSENNCVGGSSASRYHPDNDWSLTQQPSDEEPPAQGGHVVHHEPEPEQDVTATASAREQDNVYKSPSEERFPSREPHSIQSARAEMNSTSKEDLLSPSVSVVQDENIARATELLQSLSFMSEDVDDPLVGDGDDGDGDEDENDLPFWFGAAAVSLAAVFVGARASC